MKTLLNIEDCKEYLSQNYFTDIQFSHENENGLNFTVFCEEEEENATIQFEQSDDTTVFVNVKYESSDHFIVFERLSMED
jgi:hypothetical protein